MADQVMYSDPWSDLRREYTVDHADIRREQAVGHGEIKYAIASTADATNRDVLSSGFHTQVKVDEAADKIQQRAADYFISEQARDFDAARDLADIKVQVAMGNQKTASDIAVAAERVLGATALSQAQTAKEIAESKYDLSRQIGIENEKTRDLINSLKNDELNRLLIERNTDINSLRGDYWGCRDGLLNSQFAALSSQVNSQVNALNSQLAETRQGMVNFGTMAGVGQSSTNNQVR